MALGVGLLALAWRGDKTAEFYRVRGSYAGFDELAAWDTSASHVRLIGLRNDRGIEVNQVYVRRPHGLTDDYRIVVIYAGAKTRATILDLIPDRPDVVLVGVQYPYSSPRGLAEHLAWPGGVRRSGFRTVAGGMLALSFLEREEELDLGRSLLVGSSLGSIPATIHGALDTRVPAVLVIHGGGDLTRIVRTNVKQRWLGLAAAGVTAVVLDSFDPLHYVERIAPRRLIMISAHHDTYFPAESARMLYERARQPKEITWTETEHVRAAKTALVQQIVQQIEHYLDLDERP